MAISVLKRRITDFMQRIIETLNLDPEDIAIARRFFVMNSFDGSLTMLGIIVGSWVSGVRNPSKIVGTGLGACLAMGISGMVGAYASERAERILDRNAIFFPVFIIFYGLYTISYIKGFAGVVETSPPAWLSNLVFFFGFATFLFLAVMGLRRLWRGK